MEQGTIPTQQEVIDYFIQEGSALKIDTRVDLENEAEKWFKFFEKKHWRDKTGQRIKWWTSVADKSLANLKQKAKHGYTAAKKLIEIPDCCFRPMSECDCATLIFRGKGYKFPEDTAKAVANITEAENAAYSFLINTRRIHTIPIASYAEQSFIRSAATDIGRGVLEIPEQSEEYFKRMVAWLFFAYAQNPNWCHLGPEIIDALCKWHANNDIPSPITAEVTHWDLIKQAWTDRINR